MAKWIWADGNSEKLSDDLGRLTERLQPPPRTTGNSAAIGTWVNTARSASSTRPWTFRRKNNLPCLSRRFSRVITKTMPSWCEIAVAVPRDRLCQCAHIRRSPGRRAAAMSPRDPSSAAPRLPSSVIHRLGRPATGWRSTTRAHGEWAPKTAPPWRRRSARAAATAVRPAWPDRRMW